MTIKAFENHFPQLAPGAWVADEALVVGQCVLGEDASVWPMAVLRGDVNFIEIGARTNIQDGVVVHVTHESEWGPGAPTRVGADVTVGHNATLHGCTIEDEVLIGMNAVVLDGAVVPRHTIVGAHALVPPGKVLESGWLYVGAPVKKARPLTEEEKAFFKYSAAHYVALKVRHARAS
ncbi:Carbonic anhydrase or acetyltransferase, isoleucine patch superfamily [Sulfurivirga caldicuralii]|uniref:Carbonic anhydrase or acetyltransferase, isoleucine patch superfamily n=1 Tax=Sulfurivirga caldicuralii TaxID=364032 RepID=A0A1N6DHN5_9GAMM|nr:gamma carbonic anhydrase family protein [Sulfurivirga caldicuralii]SIN70237.1 Carbonic anhydrase or acetyltransferase, isoleucine patch superfamily [Sulfurivirga caldicuralii]